LVVSTLSNTYTSTTAGKTYTRIENASLINAVVEYNDTLWFASNRGLLRPDEFDDFLRTVDGQRWIQLIATESALIGMTSPAILEPSVVQVSTDGGRSFSSTSTAASWIASDGNRVFIADPSYGLIYSDDDAQSFQRSAGVPLSLSDRFGVVRARDHLFVYASGEGLYWSADNGTTFEPFSASIAVDPNNESNTAPLSSVRFDAVTAWDDSILIHSDELPYSLYQLDLQQRLFKAPSDLDPPSGPILSMASSQDRLFIVPSSGGLWTDSASSPRFTQMRLGHPYIEDLRTVGGIVYAQEFDNYPHQRAFPNQIYVSGDQGQTWSPSLYAYKQEEDLKIIGFGQDTLYAVSKKALLQSENAGRSWTPIGRSPTELTRRLYRLPSGQFVLFSKIRASEYPLYEFAGTMIWMSDDGERWRDISNQLPVELLTDGSFIADRVDLVYLDGRIVVHLNLLEETTPFSFNRSELIIYSDDEGRTWSSSSLPSDLEDAPIIDIEDSAEEAYFLAGSSLFVSNDRGQSFSERWTTPRSDLRLIDLSTNRQAIALLDDDGDVWLTEDKAERDFTKLDCGPCRGGTAVLLTDDALYVARQNDAIYVVAR
ncbi:MAG: sialidase family protein, partial [Myxococcota bacterium]